jgi:tetratricopeptide (TPR) repeat protein
VFCIYTWRRRQKVWGCAWAYYVITLLPVLGIIQVGNQAAADRYTYLPVIGLFTIFGTGVIWVLGRAYIKQLFTRIIKLMLIAALLIIISLTLKQESVWRDSITLWTSEINKFGNNYKAYKGRAEAYMKAGNYKKAVKDLKRSIKINPRYATTYAILGMAYERLDGKLQAIESYGKALDINPEFELARYERERVFLDALRDYEKEMKKDPDSEVPYINRGTAYALMKKYQLTLDDYSTAIRLNPLAITVYYNRGMVFMNQGKYNEAISDFETVIGHNPGDFQAHFRLGLAFEKLGEAERSRRYIQEAARLGSGEAQGYLRSKGVVW